MTGWTLTLNGVYAEVEGKPVFIPARNLTDDDVRQIVETTAVRVIRLLTKGLSSLARRRASHFGG